MDNFVNESNDQGITQLTHSWVMEINEQLSKVETIPEAEPLKNKKITIYRRPVNVSEKENSFDYTPRIVSFGPYHHDDESCRKTNEIKKCALICFLQRSQKKLDDYVEALSEDVKDLKDAYDQLDPKWQHEDDAFLQLMIYDGCFLLEILREAESLEAENHLGYYSRQIRAMYGISPKVLMEYYKHDMLLLENQLPMMLLLKLVAVQNDSSIQEAQKYLYELVLRFVAPPSANIAGKLLRQEPERKCLHFLDLYRHSLLCEEDDGRSNSRRYKLYQRFRSFIKQLTCGELMKTIAFTVLLIMLLLAIIEIINIIMLAILLVAVVVTILFIVGPLELLKCCCRTRPPTDIKLIIPSAMELDKVGIGLKMKSTRSLSDISFEYVTLRLPEIYVDGATQSRFLNIIAFEQLHPDAKNEVTSYIYFMSKLLQVAADAGLLQLRCIILTPLQNVEVVELFKILRKDIAHDPDIFFVKTYGKVCKRLTTAFYVGMNDPWAKDLAQTYFKSPWAIISVGAAFALFALTSIQTVYTVLGYYNRK